MPLIRFFYIFARSKRKTHKPMTQKEAVIQALEKLGGEASLKEITAVAFTIKGADWTKAGDPKANIRRIVRENTEQICVTGNARYGLVGHRNKIEELTQHILLLQAENETLRKRQTVEEFIDVLVDTSIEAFELESDRIIPIRSVLHDLNCKEAVARIDKWYNNKNKVVPYVNHADQLNFQCDVKHH